jgi:(2R)-3-sulfolactate dehydrogenase (NADP+)
MTVARLRALGFSESDAETLAAHFLDAERRGKHGHGLSRVDWLETGPVEFDPAARPTRVLREAGYERWDGTGVLGYLVLAAIVEAQLAEPPEHARVVVAQRTFPTGMLGYWGRKLADGGLVAAVTATSPARLGHPEGGPKLAGTNPLALAIPGSEPLVADVSMGRVTYGDVIAGAASEEELVPFGGEHAHKAFALALGLQLLVDALVAEPGHGAVLVVARPEADPLPALRARAAGVRLPGQS